jgi:hypothetical protein
MHDLLFLVKVICVFALEPLRAEARLVGGTSKDRQVDGVVMDVSATSHGVRTMPKHASWEAPSDLVDGGMNAALALWSVPIPVPEDPITGPKVPSGKMMRCRLFAAAVAQLGSRPVAKGQRRAGSHRTHLCRPMMFSLFPG